MYKSPKNLVTLQKRVSFYISMFFQLSAGFRPEGLAGMVVPSVRPTRFFGNPTFAGGAATYWNTFLGGSCHAPCLWSQVAFEKERWAHEFEKRVLERAYFLYINGVSEDEMYNYFEALRIEFGQRPY